MMIALSTWAPTMAPKRNIWSVFVHGEEVPRRGRGEQDHCIWVNTWWHVDVRKRKHHNISLTRIDIYDTCDDARAKNVLNVFLTLRSLYHVTPKSIWYLWSCHWHTKYLSTIYTLCKKSFFFRLQDDHTSYLSVLGHKKVRNFAAK